VLIQRLDMRAHLVEHRPRRDGAVSGQFRQECRDLDGTFGPATTPNSAAWPRRALIAWVRWATSISRYLRTMPQMMGATARLQYHLSCLLFAEESFNLAALEFSPQHRAFLLIDTVKREHVLGRIAVVSVVWTGSGKNKLRPVVG
jgi:hypothetical protein